MVVLKRVREGRKALWKGVIVSEWVLNLEFTMKEFLPKGVTVRFIQRVQWKSTVRNEGKNCESILSIINITKRRENE